MEDEKITLRIRKLDLQTDLVRGCIEQNNNDRSEYTVYLNSRLSEDEQAAGVIHEFLHAYYRDFEQADNGRTADELEQEMDSRLKRIAKILLERP